MDGVLYGKYRCFGMMTYSNPFYILHVLEAAACLTLQGSLSTPPSRSSEDRCTQMLFSCIFQELRVKNEMHLQSVTEQERAVGSMALRYFLVSSYTCSLALLWLCFVSTLYGHRNETSHIFKHF